ncbi:MAG: ATP-binding protein [Ignavibacteria bacterium]|jgi:signal transduction histidine kinase|nr:ATP-binding protein [Ignavibacteria bacterium]
MQEKEQKTKLLVVEDELLVAEDISARLRTIGYEIAGTVPTGEEALEMCETAAPDVILMDIKMGKGMDGIETQKIIREKYNIPVIYLTSYSDPVTVSRAKITEPYGYIIKPFDERELHTTIEMAVHKHKTEKALLDREKELRELNKTKDKLFSIIAHDLKNPFMGILGFTEVLTYSYDKYSDEERQKMIYFLHNSAQNTFRLLENLLEWSRIQISGVKVVPEKIDAEELISDTAETLIESASRKNITVSVNTEKNFRIYTDADMLKTIVRNLLSNAVKFTPKGGSIYLTASKTKTGLKITVRDNGRGMPGEKLKTLFVLEKNTSTNGTDGEKGTGLGLVLCKEFTEKLQGRITAESAVGKGTTVTVEIPAYKK